MSASSSRRQFRPARPPDEEHVLDLVVDAHLKLGAIYGIKPEATSLIETVRAIMRDGICLVGDHGCAGGNIIPYPWNRNARVGVVVFWNFTRPSGIHVFRALMDEFRRQGATHINCASHFPFNRAGRHYVKRLDMRPVEVQYLKKL